MPARLRSRRLIARWLLNIILIKIRVIRGLRKSLKKLQKPTKC
jgi:hypothetical protein